MSGRAGREAALLDKVFLKFRRIDSIAAGVASILRRRTEHAGEFAIEFDQLPRHGLAFIRVGVQEPR